ncbi:MAG: Na+/H+ antiporter subunit B [Vicinamibacterales bacterium]
MNSIILRTAARALEPLLIVFSIFLLLAGHNSPGGGFVGGLVAAAAFSLHALAHDPGQARASLHVDPRTLVGLGLLLGFGAAIAALFTGRPLFTGLWTEVHVAGFGRVALGTPLLFDAGVYCLVAGVALLMILTLAED